MINGGNFIMEVQCVDKVIVLESLFSKNAIYFILNHDSFPS